MTLHAMFPLSSFSIPVKKNNNNSYGSAKSCTRQVVCAHTKQTFLTFHDFWLVVWGPY